MTDYEKKSDDTDEVVMDSFSDNQRITHAHYEVNMSTNRKLWLREVTKAVGHMEMVSETG